nr:hypothetical protein [Salinicola tamaricis]
MPLTAEVLPLRRGFDDLHDLGVILDPRGEGVFDNLAELACQGEIIIVGKALVSENQHLVMQQLILQLRCQGGIDVAHLNAAHFSPHMGAGR